VSALRSLFRFSDILHCYLDLFQRADLLTRLRAREPWPVHYKCG